MKKIFLLISLIVVSVSCSDDNDAPVSLPVLTVAENISPVNNAICQGITPSGGSGIEVTLNWNSYGTEAGILYTVTLTNTVTLEEIDVATSDTEIIVNLNQNTAYTWSVHATFEDESVIGDTWQFQTPYEAETNYAPFPASLIAPLNEESTALTDITFVWEGNDPDLGETDTLVYDLYLGTTSTPALHTGDLSLETITVSLSSGTTYYWFVKSKDVNGNTSFSQTKEFRIL